MYARSSFQSVTRLDDVFEDVEYGQHYLSLIRRKNTDDGDVGEDEAGEADEEKLSLIRTPDDTEHVLVHYDDDNDAHSAI